MVEQQQRGNGYEEEVEVKELTVIEEIDKMGTGPAFIFILDSIGINFRKDTKTKLISKDEEIRKRKTGQGR